MFVLYLPLQSQKGRNLPPLLLVTTVTLAGDICRDDASTKSDLNLSSSSTIHMGRG